MPGQGGGTGEKGAYGPSGTLSRKGGKGLRRILQRSFTRALFVRDSATTLSRRAALDWLRNLAGGMPNCRLKARLKEGSDSYPTSAAISATLRLVVLRSCAPSC